MFGFSFQQVMLLLLKIIIVLHSKLTAKVGKINIKFNNGQIKITKMKNDTYRIFCEYMYCEVTNGKETKQLTPENLVECVKGKHKLVLKSLYDMPQDLIDQVFETDRHHRRLYDALYPQPKGFKLSVSQESRNDRYDNNRFMISYMRFDKENPVKREGYMEGISDWFCIKKSLSVTLLKSLGYDLGSYWNKEENLSETEFAI